MSKETYVIRITVEGGLYKDYIVEADNLFFAKMRARNAFFKEFPSAKTNIKMSLQNPDTKKIREVIEIIEREA